MDQLRRIVDSAYSSDITYFFVALIIIVLGLAILFRFLLAILGRRLRPAFLSNVLGGFDRAAPTLLTTVGVLGTFTGIFFGLLDFDVANIDDSVPQLLGGLKIAFVTSIFGMAAMIVLRFIQAIVPLTSTGETEVTPETLHATLEGIKTGIDKASEQEMEALDKLRKAVSAESDSSLLTQVQKLRTDFKNGQDELIQEFRQFAQTMAENNSKALIEALEKVIRDFNTQLSEQFGENFKQLNQAVGALLTWQESYRQHVETLEARFSVAVQGIEASEQAIREIVAHTATIPPTLEKLEEIVQGIGDATIELNGHLGAVSGLKEQALQAFPVIEQNLKQLTDDLSNALQRQRDANDRIHQGFDRLLDNSREAQTRFEQAMREQIEKSFNNFDQQMQDEVNRSIETLGRNLASLSDRFVQEYGPFADRVRELVKSVEGRD